MSDLVPAIWNGPYPTKVPDPSNGAFKWLQPGDEHLVTEGDLLSAHWKPKGKQPRSAAKQAAEQKAADEAAADDSAADPAAPSSQAKSGSER